MASNTIQLKDASNNLLYPTGTVLIRQCESNEVTISSNANQWVSLNQPTITGYNPCGPVRWYISGTNATMCNVYAVENNSIAVRNMASSAATIKITATVLYYASYS